MKLQLLDKKHITSWVAGQAQIFTAFTFHVLKQGHCSKNIKLFAKPNAGHMR